MPLENEPFVVKVAPVGSGAAVKEVIPWASGSEAETTNEISEFSLPLADGGAVTTGGRSFAETVIAVVAVPESAFDAVKTMLYGLPAAWPTVGVQLKVPEVKDAFAENVAPAGSGAAVNDVIV